MSWGGPGRRYSHGGTPQAAAAGTPPLPSPRYLTSAAQPAVSPCLASQHAPEGSFSPWSRSSAAGSSAAASPEAASTAATDDDQLQSLVSALRVALGKKEAALVSVAGQLAEAQARLTGCETERQRLAVRLREVEPAAPDSLTAAAGLTPEGRLLAQARQELGQEAARAAELAAERDALRRDVAMLQQQLTAAAQAEAVERERLCAEASQSRLLAKARARQVDQLQAELRRAAGACSSVGAAAAQEAHAAAADASAARAAAADAAARTAAAEALAAHLQQQLAAVQAEAAASKERAAKAEADAAEAQQQLDWQAQRISELEQTSSVGQLMRRYEAEVQRLRAQHEAERQQLEQQLAQARQQQGQSVGAAQHLHPAGLAAVSQEQPACRASTPAGLDSAAWDALFEEPSGSSQHADAVEAQDAWVQTDEQQQGSSVDPALVEAARLEIERLREVNAGLLESHEQAQQAIEEVKDQRRRAVLDSERQAEASRATATAQQLALEAARRAEAGLREQLTLMERQLDHQSGEVQALRLANEKLELATAALKEDADAAGEMVPAEDVEALRAELQRAVQHTCSLETQVQQLREQAAVAAAQHASAVAQQRQQGAADAAAQAAAAAEVARAQQSQQADQLHAQLAEANQQLQVTRSALSDLVQEQLLRREGMRDAGVQVAWQPAAEESKAVQTEDAAQPSLPGGAVMTAARVQSTATEAPQMDAGWAPWLPAPKQGSKPAAAAPLAAWQLSAVGQAPLTLSRAGSACESPAPSWCSAARQSPAPSVAQTAKQLQLELARVKLAMPMRPLSGGFQPRAGSGLGQVPSRLGSALGEHALVASRGDGLLLSTFRSTASSMRGSSDGQHAAAEAEEDDDEGCFATPLASTPTAMTPEVGPLCGQAAGAGDERLGWQQPQLPPPHAAQHLPLQALQHAYPPQQQQQQQQEQQPWARAVPALDLRLVRPYTSLSCESSPLSDASARSARSARSPPVQPLAEASGSVSSLSSVGPSASEMAGWSPGLLLCPAGAGEGGGSGSGVHGWSSPTHQGIGQRGSSQSCMLDTPAQDGCGSSWQSERLDASLARLAALTQGLVAGRGQR